MEVKTTIPPNKKNPKKVGQFQKIVLPLCAESALLRRSALLCKNNGQVAELADAVCWVHFQVGTDFTQESDKKKIQVSSPVLTTFLKTK